MKIVIFLLFLVSCGPSLERKLEYQWKKYDQAKALLLANPDKIVTRELWEKTLKLPSKYEIDVTKLKELQKIRVQKAKAAAIAESGFDLNSIRTDSKKVRQFCSKIPKGGMLHIHPFGTFSSTTLRRLLNKYNPVIETKELISELSDQSKRRYLYKDEIVALKSVRTGKRFKSLSVKEKNTITELLVLPRGAHEFERFDAVFSMLSLAVPDYDHYFDALIDFGRRAANQGVFYIEFTSGVKAKKIAFIEKLVKKFNTDFGIILRYNHSFFRFRDPTVMRKKARELLNYVDKPWLVGIDLLGNEKETPALEWGQASYTTILADGRLSMTMHAGELGDPRNPRDAMIMGVKRIGHGVALMNDPVALEYAIKKKIAVEINLNSNLQLKVIDRIENHPYLHFLRLGLPISLSTDDEGIFNTDINSECELAVSKTDVTYSELRKMSYNSIATSFTDDKTKAGLLNKLKTLFEKFEKNLMDSTVK